MDIVETTQDLGGRPTKRTEAITKRIAEAIAQGLTNQEAADLVEIDDMTLYRWQQIPEFADAIKSAKAKRKLLRLQRIEEGAPGWVGSAWILERQDDNWARLDHKILLRGTTVNNTQINNMGPNERAYREKLFRELPVSKEVAKGILDAE